MLQQTQVKTVLPYYERFIKTYPTLEALARAEENEVLSLWSGMGYYGRARNLWKAAQLVCERHAGEFPTNYDEAMDLPGIGRYTAGAILSIAYGQALPVLDGNVLRVFARYLKIEEDWREKESQELWNFLSKLVAHPSIAAHVADFNQALMELGARICTPRNPQCPLCPLTESCRSRRAGLQEILPRARPRRELQAFNYLVAVVRRGPKYLLMQNTDGRFLRGLWELPRTAGTPGGDVAETFAKVYNLRLKILAIGVPVAHRMTSRRLILYPVQAKIEGRLPPRTPFIWAEPRQDQLPVPSFFWKILETKPPEIGS